MSKKTKQNKREEKKELQLPAKDVLENKKEESVEEIMENEVQKFHCAEAAEKLINGYNTRWLPSLRAFAKQNAMDGDHSIDEWKDLYIKWGAKIK